MCTHNSFAHIMGGDDITRMKNHWANLDAQMNVKIYDKVPLAVGEEMWALLFGNVEKKKKKHTLDATIRNTLNNIVTNDDSDDDGDCEVKL